MIQDYFLGGNTAEGFYSLYGGFPPGAHAFVHILKGGPGTGKSTLLRAIAREADRRGMEVERVLCSGDPDSLDGVYLPALGLAWVDGTAPHVIEPGLFGANGDYSNLGAFFSVPFSSEEKSQLLALQTAYKACYRRAYALLAECPRGSETRQHCSEAQLRDALEALPVQEKPGHRIRRFASAITCKGLVHLPLASEDYAVLRASAAALSAAAEEAQRRGWNLILCPSPLFPDETEALLLPEKKLAFSAVSDSAEAHLPHLEKAVETLREAKGLHDELEALYRPHMNFQGLTAYTEALLKKLFPPID
jgi:hypothetical protein